MLFFSTKSARAAEQIARKIADGRRFFTICTGSGAEILFDQNGKKIMQQQIEKPHFDSVSIDQYMTEKQLTAARTRAAGRETIRRKEEKAALILSSDPDSLSTEDRAALLSLVNVAYHGEGSKIEGCHSIDSCASCEFCQNMIRSGAKNILIICGSCYAAADAWKEFAWRQHNLNARILSQVLFTVDELKALRLPKKPADAAAEQILCRFNEDGDTVNEIMARNYLRIAAAFLWIMFGYWYKNSAAVAAGLRAEGYTDRDSLPQNVRFIHSSLLIGFEATALWFDDAIFTVYPDDETTAAAIAAGAHECNGRRCRACGYKCYLMRRRPEPLRIAEYLRCNKTKRAAIRAAYDELKARHDAYDRLTAARA